MQALICNPISGQIETFIVDLDVSFNFNFKICRIQIFDTTQLKTLTGNEVTTDLIF